MCMHGCMHARLLVHAYVCSRVSLWIPYTKYPYMYYCN